MNSLVILLIGVGVVVGGILVLRLHAFLSLIAGALTVALLTPTAKIQLYYQHTGMTPSAAQAAAQEPVGDRIADGFSDTAKSVGILIAMAAIVGKTLMDSGAAEKIVLSLRRSVGEERVSLAFLISGFCMAALILSDSVFFLLIPLARVMRVRSGKDYTLYILSIVAGAVMTHSLVPPAAGPALVAAKLKVDLGVMILGGTIVGGIASIAGYGFALWANRVWQIPLRGAAGVSAPELEHVAKLDENTLPPLWLSVLPIVVPVLLIATNSIVKSVNDFPAKRVFATLGDRNIALSIAAAIGLLIVWTQRLQKSRPKLQATVVQALSSGGIMVLTICAGGALGFLIRQTDIASQLQTRLPEQKLAILPLAFLVTMMVRTSVGSAIVSMITAIGIFGPIALAGNLGFHPVYLALAIGCGSKPILWMNDAGFWIITQMSGMTEAETLKTVTIMMAIMGVVGLLATMGGAWLLPMR